MCVDGECDTRRLIRRLLRDLGHETIEAHNAPEIVELLGGEPEHLPDLLLLADNLLGPTGWDVARRMKALPAWGPRPIVFMTQTVTNACVVQAHEIGAAGMLAKPFSVGLFQHCIETVLGDPRARPPGMPVFIDPAR